MSSAEDWARAHRGCYDTITCMEMLEHVPQPERVVQACARLVRPGGWVFLSTINRTALSYWVAIVGAERILRLLPAGTHHHARFIKPQELQAMGQRYGLTLQDQRGLGYNPFTQRFRLHRFMGVGYLLALQMP
jgi:2-polyprenyl-6-hydroxyphenyl methylase / 3-demethylubiquinone-9 3-methyltransferase